MITGLVWEVQHPVLNGTGATGANKDTEFTYVYFVLFITWI